jgi:hypothetical protein
MSAKKIKSPPKTLSEQVTELEKQIANDTVNYDNLYEKITFETKKLAEFKTKLELLTYKRFLNNIPDTGLSPEMVKNAIANGLIKRSETFLQNQNKNLYKENTNEQQ